VEFVDIHGKMFGKHMASTACAACSCRHMRGINQKTKCKNYLTYLGVAEYAHNYIETGTA